MQDDQLASDMLVGSCKYSSLQPCISKGASFFKSTLNLDTNATMDSARQTEQPSPIPQTMLEQQNPSRNSQEGPPFLPPLDIEAATSSKEQWEISQWSTADSFWASTPTAVEKSFEPSIRSSMQKDLAYKEKGLTKHVLPSLKASSSDERSISVLSLPISAVPLAVEDPSRTLSMSLLRKIALVLVACSAQFLNLGGMNQTVAPVMVLADYFQIRDYGTLSWFSAAYSMTVGTFILPAGKRNVSCSYSAFVNPVPPLNKSNRSYRYLWSPLFEMNINNLLASIIMLLENHRYPSPVKGYILIKILSKVTE